MAQGNLVYFCKVEDVKDDNGGLRIQVRIPYMDSSFDGKDKLVDAFPLLPKFMHVNPKKGEMVFVFLESLEDGKSNRFFLGPVISQPQKMDKDNYVSAQNLLRGTNPKDLLPEPSLNPDNNGTLPDRYDIAIEGRGNTDLILKPNELLLRCGYKVDANAPKSECLKFNKVNPGYVQMKYFRNPNNGNKEYSTVTNIVADKINLLSHESRTYFNLANPDGLITEEEMEKIFQKAHQLPYGDKLVDFLKDFVRIFLIHTHPFAMDKPILNQADMTKLIDPHFDEMLSDSVRIN